MVRQEARLGGQSPEGQGSGLGWERYTTRLRRNMETRWGEEGRGHPNKGMEIGI